VQYDIILHFSLLSVGYLYKNEGVITDWSIKISKKVCYYTKKRLFLGEILLISNKMITFAVK